MKPLFSLCLALTFPIFALGQARTADEPHAGMRLQLSAPQTVTSDPRPRWPTANNLSMVQPGAPEAIPPGEAAAAPTSLTLADLERIALANNPALVQALARVQAARGA